MANFYLLAPEIMNDNSIEEEINDLNDGTPFNKAYTTAIDIYAFGIVALELAVLGIKNNFNMNNKSNQQPPPSQSNPHHRMSEGNINHTNYFTEFSGSFVSRDTIKKAIDMLDNDLQKDFIRKCLAENPADRPTARELLFHPVIFEVPSLKVICSSKILNNSPTAYSLEQVDEEFNTKMKNTQTIIAEINYKDGHQDIRRICDLSKLNTEYLEKFFEEVRNGVYPLYAFQPQNTAPKNKINKLMKAKRNSLKNIVESSMNQINQSMKLELCNGSNGSRDKLDRLHDQMSDDNEQNINLNGNQNVINQTDENDDVGEECQDEEDDYDQEDVQNDEDYENRCETCASDVYEEETRRIEKIEITLKSTTSGQSLMKNDGLFCLDLNQEIIILLKLDDKMNRKLSASLSSTSDNGTVLANELVTNGFINSVCFRFDSSFFLFSFLN